MPDPRVTLRKMGLADQKWSAAIEESAYAPPDDGFADRLRAIAVAAKAEAEVLHEAATQPKLRWNPTVPAKAARRLTYELRPGGNRPGPAELWDLFDERIERMLAAQAGSDFAEIAGCYGDLSEVLADLADAVDEERGVAVKRRRRRTG